MTKLYHAVIEVETADGQPRRFRWRNRWREIRTVYERSVVQADWWRREVNRAHYSIQCDDMGEFDIYRQGDRWFLERVWD
ncbi:MAG TPA: hypothetical protein VG815_13460 [Chloroflexota bacterium]|nr:hypothetical protein [Chloroflexota bacterium]